MFMYYIKSFLGKYWFQWKDKILRLRDSEEEALLEVWKVPECNTNKRVQLILEEKGLVPKEQVWIPRKQSSEPGVLRWCGNDANRLAASTNRKDSPDTQEKQQYRKSHS